MKILLVDDHAMFADSLKTVLASHYTVTTVSCGQDALTALSTVHHKIVLLDQNLPDLDGLTLTKVFRSLPDPPSILLLSGDNDYSLIRAAKQAGACGFLHKSLSAKDLLKAVERVRSGASIWTESNNVCNELNLIEPERDSHWNHQIIRQMGITERQLEVLKLMSNGLSNKAIARELSIAESTVKTHVKSLFQVLKATNRMTCYQRAMDLGLLVDTATSR